MDFFVSDMGKFWLVIGKFFLTWKFLLDMRFWLEQNFGHDKNFLLGIGFFFFFFFFFFVFLLWSEYFVSILMIGQLCFAEPQESR